MDETKIKLLESVGFTWAETGGLLSGSQQANTAACNHIEG